MEYLRRGEILGNLECVQELIDLARHDDNSEEYAILYIQQARMGGTTRDLMPLYRDKLISKVDVATTLRLHRSVNDEMKTVDRIRETVPEFFRRQFKRQNNSHDNEI